MKTFGIKYLLPSGTRYIVQIQARDFDEAEAHLHALQTTGCLLGELVTFFDIDIPDNPI